VQTTTAAVTHRGTLARVVKNDLGLEAAVWYRKESGERFLRLVRDETRRKNGWTLATPGLFGGGLCHDRATQ